MRNDQGNKQALMRVYLIGGENASISEPTSTRQLFVLLYRKVAHTIPQERKTTWEHLSVKRNSSLN